jgi:hypothetical protein
VHLTEIGRSAMKKLGQSQIRWSSRIAAGAIPKEIDAALAMIKIFRLHLEADAGVRMVSDGRDCIRPATTHVPTQRRESVRN